MPLMQLPWPKSLWTRCGEIRKFKAVLKRITSAANSSTTAIETMLVDEIIRIFADMTGFSPLPIIYAGNKRVGTWWNYRNIISPFYRLYYISAGRGQIYMHSRCYELTPGKLFIIPKFTLHSYNCDDFMDHNYVCFFDEGENGELICDRDRLQCLVDAGEYDCALMDRLIKLNPLKSLTYVDPAVYDNGNQNYHSSMAQERAVLTESTGILMQLVSRFMTGDSFSKASHTSEKIEIISRYISKHMAEPISIDDMASLLCISPGHFSRLFKRLTGESPSKYLHRRRVERAQHMLLTSEMSVSEIADRVGVPNLSQFTRMFSGLCGCSPREYRNIQPEKIT